MNLTLPLLTALLNFQNELIRERTQAGLEAAKSRGRTGGRPRALSPVQALELSQLYDSGQLSVPELAARFSIAPTTVHSYLRRRTPLETL